MDGLMGADGKHKVSIRLDGTDWQTDCKRSKEDDDGSSELKDTSSERRDTSRTRQKDDVESAGSEGESKGRRTRRKVRERCNSSQQESPGRKSRASTRAPDSSSSSSSSTRTDTQPQSHSEGSDSEQAENTAKGPRHALVVPATQPYSTLGGSELDPVAASSCMGWLRYAQVMAANNDVEKAIAGYHKALAIKPDLIKALLQLGGLYQKLQMLREAGQCYHAAVMGYNNALKEAGAVHLPGPMAAPQPLHPLQQLHPLLSPQAPAPPSSAPQQQQQLQQQLLLSTHPAPTLVQPVPGVVGFQQGQHALIHALQPQVGIPQQFPAVLPPEAALSFFHLGNIYKEMARLDEAIKCYSVAAMLNPTLVEAYSNLGNACKDTGRMEAAITNYRAALMLKPDLPEALCNLAHALHFVCDWAERDAIMGKVEAVTRQQLLQGQTPSVQPFHALAHPLPLKLIRAISICYAQCCNLQVSAILPTFQRECVRSPVVRRPGERINVGYVSSDFVNHPLAHLTQSVFGMHDKTRFKVTCFSLSPSDGSEFNRKISKEVEEYVDISQLSFLDAARFIRALNIHVLFNLNGYTKGARNEIFALQPAPVQVSYMGFCGTMGASFIQYLVTDPVASPLQLESLYTEKLVHMPHCYFVNDYAQSSQAALDPAQCPTRRDLGIPEDKIVLCNFNQVYKIDPKVLDIWCKILKALPNTVLWLLRFPHVGEVGIRREARARGVPDERIIFTEVAHKPEHIKRGACADLFLDTLQCNAHTTGCDILWSGTPLITLPQAKMSCRVAASLLTALGLEELIMRNAQHYLDEATRLCACSQRVQDVEGKWSTTGALGELKHRIMRERLTRPLFDTKRWVENLERGIEIIWEKHERGQPPEHVAIQDVMDGSVGVEPPVDPELLKELDSEVPPVILPSCLRPSPLLPQHAAHLLAPAPIVPASRPLFTATIVPPAAAPPESVAAHLAPAVVAQLAAHPPALPPLAAPQPGVARPLVAYQPPVALKARQVGGATVPLGGKWKEPPLDPHALLGVYMQRAVQQGAGGLLTLDQYAGASGRGGLDLAQVWQGPIGAFAAGHVALQANLAAPPAGTLLGQPLQYLAVFADPAIPAQVVEPAGPSLYVQ